MKSKSHILLVVDPQLTYFTPDLLPVVDSHSIDNIAAIARHFNGEKFLIKHVQAGTSFDVDAPGHMFHPALADIKFDQVFQKSTASAIRWDLHAVLVYLKKKYALEIVVVGYQTHHCVLTTAFDSCDFGDVFVVSDACSSPDVDGIPGSTMHDAALASLSQFYCRVLTTREAFDRFCRLHTSIEGTVGGSLLFASSKRSW